MTQPTYYHSILVALAKFILFFRNAEIFPKLFFFFPNEKKILKKNEENFGIL
jgi:hypothetical protein